MVFRSGGFQISIIYSGLAAHGDKAMDKPGYVITTDTVVQLLNPACHHQIMVGTFMVGTGAANRNLCRGVRGWCFLLPHYGNFPPPRPAAVIVGKQASNTFQLPTGANDNLCHS